MENTQQVESSLSNPAPTTIKKYVSPYIRFSKIKKDLFIEGEKKIRIAKDAIEDIQKIMEDAIKNAIKNMIAKLPRYTRGEKVGQLKSITIQKELLGESNTTSSNLQKEKVEEKKIEENKVEEKK